MKKKSKLLRNFATILFFCMASLLLYVWSNFDTLSSDQAFRQMRYLNQKNKDNY